METRSGGVFEQNGEVMGRQAERRVAESQGERGDALFDRVAPVAARVDHQVIGADGDGAVELAAECVDGLGPDDGV